MLRAPGATNMQVLRKPRHGRLSFVRKLPLRQYLLLLQTQTNSLRYVKRAGSATGPQLPPPQENGAANESVSEGCRRICWPGSLTSGALAWKARWKRAAPG